MKKDEKEGRVETNLSESHHDEPSSSVENRETSELIPMTRDGKDEELDSTLGEEKAESREGS